MTPEQWKAVENGLFMPYDSVSLKVDGFALTLETHHVEKMKLAIVVFVDGWVKGEWLMNDCEERRRFMRPVTRRIHSKKEEAVFRRLARLLKDKKPFVNTMTTYTWVWPNFAPLKRHLIANNRDIVVAAK